MESRNAKWAMIPLTSHFWNVNRSLNQFYPSHCQRLTAEASGMFGLWLVHESYVTASLELHWGNPPLCSWMKSRQSCVWCFLVGLAVWLWHRFKSETFQPNKQSHCLLLPQNWGRMHLSQSVLVCLCVSPSHCVYARMCVCARVCARMRARVFLFVVVSLQVAGWDFTSLSYRTEADCVHLQSSNNEVLSAKHLCSVWLLHNAYITSQHSACYFMKRFHVRFFPLQGSHMWS